jgi:hypothetical protein
MAFPGQASHNFITDHQQAGIVLLVFGRHLVCPGCQERLGYLAFPVGQGVCFLTRACRGIRFYRSRGWLHLLRRCAFIEGTLAVSHRQPGEQLSDRLQGFIYCGSWMDIFIVGTRSGRLRWKFNPKERSQVPAGFDDIIHRINRSSGLCIVCIKGAL